MPNTFGYYNSTDFSIANYYLDSNPYEFYNSTTLTLIDTNASNCGDGEYLEGNGTCMNFVTGVENTTISIYYNATQSQTVSGTINGGTLNQTQHNDGLYDSITFNFTEVAGSPGLDLRMNFTGINRFNQGVIRYKTSTLSGTYPIIQVWNYDILSWEDYPAMSESKSFATITQPVFDYSSHIGEGVVQMRLYKVSNGNINNHYYVDWVAISRGIGVPAGEEVDPYSWHRNQSDSGNFTTTGNVTASFFFGNGSGLTNVPGGNASWNQSFADTIYYDLGNSYSFYNSTNPQTETDSICSSYGYYNSTNPMPNTFGYYNSTDFSIADYYLDSNPYSFYNSTTLPEGSDTNETPRVNELYSFGYYNSTDFSIADYYLDSNPYGFYNSTNPMPNTFGYYNSTDFSIANYYLDSNPYGFYNSTNPSPDTNFSSGGVSTGDINISGANLYISEDQTFCLSQTCESNITFNGTHSIWH